MHNEAQWIRQVHLHNSWLIRWLVVGDVISSHCFVDISGAITVIPHSVRMILVLGQYRRWRDVSERVLVGKLIDLDRTHVDYVPTIVYVNLI